MRPLSAIHALAGRTAAAVLVAVAACASAQTVTFPDANLEAAVRQAIPKPSGNITVGDMLTLTNLTANGRGIHNLTGLETALNLLSLDLGWNGITNPAVLANLTGLQHLYLNINDLTNVPYIAGLTNLVELALDYTRLADMSPITNLTQLIVLNVGENSLTAIPDLSPVTNLATFMMAGNQITDLSPVTNLTALVDLHVQRNAFTTIAPLAHCPHLGGLLLSGNPQLTDLAEIGTLTTLHYLQLESMLLTNLDFLTPLSGLTDLSLNDNYLTDLSSLTNLQSLWWLSVEQNRLQQITPLLDLFLGYASLRLNYLDTNVASAAWNVITNLQARGVTVDYDPQLEVPLCPLILVQPANRSAFPVDTVSFSVVVDTNSPAPEYRWQKDGVDLEDDARITGVDSDTLQVANITASDAGVYRVRIWRDWAATNSADAELRVVTNVAFADANLEAAVRETLGIPTNPLTPADVAGLNSLDASYRGITSLAGLDAAANLVSLNLSGNPSIANFSPLTFLSSLGELAVNDAGLDNLSWAADLCSLTALQVNANFLEDLSPLRALVSLESFSVTENQLMDIDPLLDLPALTGEVELSWNRLDTNATAAAWAVITNLTARGATVSFDPQYGVPVRPVIVQQPVNVVAYLGDTISFTVAATGSSSGLNYRWLKNGVNLYDAGRISGADSDTLWIGNAQADDAGSYHVRVWDDYGVTNSITVTLRVITFVAFVDPNLEQAVRSRLGIPSAPLTLEDMRGMTWLDARERGITNLSGIEAAANLDWLNLNSNPSIADFTPLVGMPRLRNLYLDNCVVPDLSFVPTLPALWELTAWNGQVTDLSPVAACPMLEILNLGYNPALTNSSVLSALTNMQYLTLERTGVSNIAFVASMPNLRYLSVLGNGVDDLGPMSGLTNLGQFEGAENLISDASPLAGCTNLDWLSLPSNQLTNLAFLTPLTTLASLNLEGNPMQDISAVAGLTNLTWLAVGWSYVTNLAPVAALTQLDSLYVWNLGISNLNYLAALTNLHLFSAGQNGITTLPPYPQLDRLVYLNLDGNPLADINFVAGMTNIWELAASRCGVANLTPLIGHTNLHYLGLALNGLSDIGPLAGLPYLEALNLWDNSLQNINPLVGLTNLNELELRFNLLDLNPGSPAMLVIETLEGRGTAVLYDPQKSAPEPITLSAPAWLGGGQFQFRVTGPAASVLEVLRSTDLIDWTYLDYVTNTTGTLTFTDSTATGNRSFYRVRTP